MKETEENIHLSMKSILEHIRDEGVYNAARGMSEMVGEELTVSEPHVRLVSFHEIPSILGGAETEAVGIYLRIDGMIPGQMMMIVPYAKALELADLVMTLPKGTTQNFGKMERSALAELGNLTGSFFLNSIADKTGIFVRPSPPAVMVDMVGAIMDIILATTDGLSDQVLLIQATFLRNNNEAQADFWIIPDRKALETLNPQA
jgi:chemotaxis protein CheC